MVIRILRKGFILALLVFLFSFQNIFIIDTNGQDNISDAKQECRKIRSGLTGVIGYSKLYLNDAVRPAYATSQYFTLKPDLFVSVGAVIKYHPKFMSEGWQFRLDPSFVKFSYGSHQKETHQNITCSIDIDIETIKIPFSLEYDFIKKSNHFHPFLRGGIASSCMITYSADFIANDNTIDSKEDLATDYLDFSRFQNSLFLSGGIDVILWNWDFTVEIGAEKSDGIHKDKFGDSFLKTSNTTNYFIQLGVLF